MFYTYLSACMVWLHFQFFSFLHREEQVGQRHISDCATSALTLLAPDLTVWSEICRDISVNSSCFSGPYSVCPKAPDSHKCLEYPFLLLKTIEILILKFLKTFAIHVLYLAWLLSFALGAEKNWGIGSGSHKTLIVACVLRGSWWLTCSSFYVPKSIILTYPAQLHLHLKAWIEHTQSFSVRRGNFSVF